MACGVCLVQVLLGQRDGAAGSGVAPDRRCHLRLARGGSTTGRGAAATQDLAGRGGPPPEVALDLVRAQSGPPMPGQPTRPAAMSGLQDTRLRQPDELVYGLPRAGHHLRGFGADPFGLPVELIVVNVRVLEHLPLAQDHGIEPFDIIGQLRQDPDEVGAGAFKFRHLSSFQAKAGARLSTILNFYGLGPWKLMGVGAPPNARDPNSG